MQTSLICSWMNKAPRIRGLPPVAADTFRDRRSPAATVCPRSEEQAPVRAMPGRAARRGGTRPAAPGIALAVAARSIHASTPTLDNPTPASGQDWSHGRAGSACSPTHRDPCCPRVRAPAVQSIPPGVDYSTPSRRTRTNEIHTFFGCPITSRGLWVGMPAQHRAPGPCGPRRRGTVYRAAPRHGYKLHGRHVSSIVRLLS